MTEVAFTFTPHPLGLRAGLPVRTWVERYRWRWLAVLLAPQRVPAVIGHISWRVLP